MCRRSGPGFHACNRPERPGCGTSSVKAPDTKSRLQRWFGPSGITTGFLVPNALPATHSTHLKLLFAVYASQLFAAHLVSRALDHHMATAMAETVALFGSAFMASRSPTSSSRSDASIPSALKYLSESNVDQRAGPRSRGRFSTPSAENGRWIAPTCARPIALPCDCSEVKLSGATLPIRNCGGSMRTGMPPSPLELSGSIKTRAFASPIATQQQDPSSVEV